MRPRLFIVSFSLAALGFIAQPASTQNKPLELAWLRLSGATWGGEAVNSRSGSAVARAGDVNNDGFDDFLVGAFEWDTVNADSVGRVYLVYGGLGTTGVHNLSSGGATFVGEDIGLVGWQTGFAVSAAGDVNNDGFDDFLIGAPNAKTNGNTGSGRVYLVYGSASLTGTYNLSTFTGGVVINGANSSDQAGTSLASPGDINDDGFDDMLIGARGAENGAMNFAGATYLIYGGASLPATIELSALGAGGVIIRGTATSEMSGDAVGAAGDVNGDLIPDLLIGAPVSDLPGKTDAGRAWIVYGSTTLPATIALASLGAAGVTINGQSGGDTFGAKLEGAGDVNGDDLDDILVGAPLGDPAVGTGVNAGRSYLIYGSTSFPGTIEAANVGTSVAGVLFTGIDGDATNGPPGDRSGTAVAAGGDMNGDGYADLLIGASNGDANGLNASGEVYLIEGGPSLPTPFALSAINARGTVLYGATSSDTAGYAVAFAGDLNNDGFADMLIGAPGGDPTAGAEAGETVVLYGGCHFIQALGPVAEGGMLKLRSHGTPGVANLTFATPFAIGQPPFAPQQPLDTKFGPWWLIDQIDLFPAAFASNGEMVLNLPMPAPGALPGVLGLTIYMQTIGVPQGNRCDLTSLLGFVVE